MEHVTCALEVRARNKTIPLHCASEHARMEKSNGCWDIRCITQAGGRGASAPRKVHFSRKSHEHSGYRQAALLLTGFLPSCFCCSRIRRVDASSMSPIEFYREYISQSTPVEHAVHTRTQHLGRPRGAINSPFSIQYVAYRTVV